MLTFINDYPEFSIFLTAAVFSGIGYFIRQLFELLIANKKRKTDLREFFWKEKINAAKKASEFYYENLAFLKLVKQNFETQINEKEDSAVLTETLQKQIAILSDRITNPEHFEHHHIRIFYDIDEKSLDKINLESFELIQEMSTIEILESDDEKIIQQKKEKFKAVLNQLKINFEKTSDIYKYLLDKIRDDINQYVT